MTMMGVKNSLFLLKRKSGAVLCLVMSDSFQPYGLQPARLLCPWDSPGKNTGVGCHALLQGILDEQCSNSPSPTTCMILYWQTPSPGRVLPNSLLMALLWGWVISDVWPKLS